MAICMNKGCPEWDSRTKGADCVKAQWWYDKYCKGFKGNQDSNAPLVSPVERGVRRPSGFKGKKTDKFLKKDSAYGQKYFCNSCGKTALGTNFMDDKHHHWKWCKWMKAD